MKKIPKIIYFGSVNGSQNVLNLKCATVNIMWKYFTEMLAWGRSFMAFSIYFREEEEDLQFYFTDCEKKVNTCV